MAYKEQQGKARQGHTGFEASAWLFDQLAVLWGAKRGDIIVCTAETGRRGMGEPRMIDQGTDSWKLLVSWDELARDQRSW